MPTSELTPDSGYSKRQFIRSRRSVHSHCQISSSDNQPLDKVSVHLNLLNEPLIDCRGVYGGPLLQTHQIILNLKCFHLQSTIKNTSCKHTWRSFDGNWTADLGSIWGMYYSQTNLFPISGNFPNFPQIQWLKMQICAWQWEKWFVYHKQMTERNTAGSYCSKPGSNL